MYGNTKHGMSRTKIYKCYKNMLHRCLNPNDKDYDYYGGRGITVCNRWLEENGFLNFFEDMGEVPEGLTLDRKNCNGNYKLSNCHWVTRKEQNNNFSNPEEKKRRISIAMTGENHWNFGKHTSEESKKKISKTKIENGLSKGQNNPFYGKHHTEEVRQKMSVAMTGVKRGPYKKRH